MSSTASEKCKFKHKISVLKTTNTPISYQSNEFINSGCMHDRPSQKKQGNNLSYVLTHLETLRKYGFSDGEKIVQRNAEQQSMFASTVQNDLILLL